MSSSILGIDFSLNSPAWCLLSESGSKWGSFHRTTKKIDRMLALETSPFKVFSDDPSFFIQIIEKERADGEYWEVERKKIENFLVIADSFIESIKPHIDEETVVFMEGISFGSSGNSLIDVSMCTALIRERLVDIVGFNKLNIYSPTSIKKFALKGNAKKDELFNQIIDIYSNDPLLKSLINPLKQNQHLWIKKSKEVETPCSDLIDATWIALYGKKILGETF